MTTTENTKKKRVKFYYIGCRINPQFSKPYYIAYNQLNKSEVKRKENCSYGKMFLTPYETKEAYEKEIEKLKIEGFRVSIY